MTEKLLFWNVVILFAFCIYIIISRKRFIDKIDKNNKENKVFIEKIIERLGK